MKLSTTILMFTVIALGTLGIVMLYSFDAGQGTHFAGKQIQWLSVGLIACVAAAVFDYRKLRRFVWVIFGGVLVILGLVFVPGLGVYVKGSYRWVEALSQRFQPSEFAKIGLIIVLAHYIALHPTKMDRFIWGLLWPALIIGPILALVFLEPDYGTTLLMAGVCGVMLVVAGVRLRSFLPMALIILAVVGYSIATNENRRERIFALFSPEASKEGRGLQAYQSRLALGAAGWEGRGLGDGRQKLGRIPEQQTDFIFSVVGEELGLVGSLMVTGGYMIFLLGGVSAAKYSQDNFGTLLAVGLTFLIGFQAFINLGVVTSILPNTGMALPFVSYGGSNMLAMMIAAGLLVNVSRQGSRNPFEIEAEQQREGEIPATQLS